MYFEERQGNSWNLEFGNGSFVKVSGGGVFLRSFYQIFYRF